MSKSPSDTLSVFRGEGDFLSPSPPGSIRTVQKGKSLSGLTIGVSFVHTLKYFSK